MAKTTRSKVPLGDWPLLTRFYGISPFELANMPPWLTRIYAEKLPEIEAQEAMRGVTVAMTPHIEKSDRDAVVRSLLRQSGEVVSAPEAAPVDPTTEEGRAVLGGLGIGVYIDSPVMENDA